jgi:hypothetical protein
MLAWLAFMVYGRGPNCGARHPHDRKIRCGAAPHPPERVHLGEGGRMWDAQGPVRLVTSHGERDDSPFAALVHHGMHGEAR